MSFLFLHGFLGGPAIWRPLVLGAGIESRAHCLVLPGHGPEPRPCGASFDDAVDGIAALLPDGPPRILVGYSMGARLGLRLLLRHPHRFSGAILIALHPGLRSDAEREARLAWERRERAFLCDHGLEAFVSRWEKLPVLRPARPLPDLVLERRRRIRLDHTVAGVAEAIEVLGLGSMPSSWDAIDGLRVAKPDHLQTHRHGHHRLGDVQGTAPDRRRYLEHVPVHLMAGAADEKYRAIAEEAWRSNPAWSFEVAPGAAHDVVHEAPAAVIRALQRAAEGEWR